MVYANRVRPAVVIAALDAVIVCLSVAAALLLRYDGSPPTSMWPKAALLAVLAVGSFIAFGRVLGVYGQVWTYASAREAGLLLTAGVLATLTLTGLTALASLAASTSPFELGPLRVTLLEGSPVPRSVPLIAGGLATGVLGLTRYHSRLFARRRFDQRTETPRVLVVGAGDLGSWLIRQFRDTRAATPVGFVDDDPGKQRRRVSGVAVLGRTPEIAEIVKDLDVEQVIVAIGRPTTELLLAVAEKARAAGATVKTVPDATEILLKGMRPDDLRSLDTERLLSRPSVQTDLTGIRDLLRGRVVLVTGAGGSIGSEIARQVAAAEPAQLLVLDNDETHLHDLRPDLPAAITLPLLADVRDELRIRRLVSRHRPSVVFHAAAHKHVPILEDHPCEAVQTNVLGTRTLLRACRDADVERFILISTDKAVAPSSVMGASKRVAELLVADMARETGRAYVSVRFGNVLGSRGSVVPIFARQIRDGGPVTITDPRMTRFFMTIPEATHLVLQAAGLAEGGDIFMLDMGSPVSIVSLAEQMIRASGQIPGVDVEIRVTGVRAGEKLAERLVDDHEVAAATGHPSLTRVTSNIPDAGTLEAEVDRMAGLCTDGDDLSVGSELLMLARSARLAEPALPG
jgi:FlaA1/EpsC-like NDP-sugar epimerase